ncbi:MAG: sulfite exporter TauE/SafE family protein, partial [Clostridia bacterium]
TLLLKNLDTAVLKIIFGFAILLISADIFVRLKVKPENNSKGSKLTLTIIGIISGVLSGLFGVGAFLVAYINRMTNDPGAFRANLCIVFMTENLFRIIIYSVTGILTLSILKQAIILIPFMLFGLFIGVILSKRLNEHTAKKIVASLLIVSGLILIITNVMFLF